MVQLPQGGFEEGKLEVSSMKKLQVKLLVASPVLLASSLVCFADTFTHRKSGEALHGYIAGQAEDGKTILSTKEKGQNGIEKGQGTIKQAKRSPLISKSSSLNTDILCLRCSKSCVAPKANFKLW